MTVLKSCRTKLELQEGSMKQPKRVWSTIQKEFNKTLIYDITWPIVGWQVEMLSRMKNFEDSGIEKFGRRKNGGY